MEQGKVKPVIEINEKVKAVAPTKKKAQSKKSELPETGGEESTNKGMLFGGLFSILGFSIITQK